MSLAGKLRVGMVGLVLLGTMAVNSGCSVLSYVSRKMDNAELREEIKVNRKEMSRLNSKLSILMERQRINYVEKRGVQDFVYDESTDEVILWRDGNGDGIRQEYEVEERLKGIGPNSSKGKANYSNQRFKYIHDVPTNRSMVFEDVNGNNRPDENEKVVRSERGFNPNLTLVARSMNQVGS